MRNEVGVGREPARGGAAEARNVDSLRLATTTATPPSARGRISRACPSRRLQAFYRKYYQPDNALVVIAGRFDPEYAIQLVAEEFGAIPRPDRTGANQLFDTYTAEPAQDGERTVTLRRVGDVQMAMAAYHVPPGSHEQYAAVDVLIHVLATRPAGRLYQNLVGDRAGGERVLLRLPAQRAGCDDGRRPGAPGGLAGGKPRPQCSPPSTRMVEAPPTEEEVERARTDYLSGIEAGLQQPAGHRAAAERMGLDGRLAPLLPAPRPAGAGYSHRSAPGWRRPT